MKPSKTQAPSEAQAEFISITTDMAFLRPYHTCIAKIFYYYRTVPMLLSLALSRHISPLLLPSLAKS